MVLRLLTYSIYTNCSVMFTGGHPIVTFLWYGCDVWASKFVMCARFQTLWLSDHKWFWLVWFICVVFWSCLNIPWYIVVYAQILEQLLHIMNSTGQSYKHNLNQWSTILKKQIISMQQETSALWREMYDCGGNEQKLINSKIFQLNTIYLWVNNYKAWELAKWHSITWHHFKASVSGVCISCRGMGCVFREELHCAINCQSN